eukprot:TRINITY_DN8884_c0_g1_i11.p1 TRINITY_DN8884_c0_g1~~TRINITY_DN8884_c0_g1_i11.p1  ORF type:complete len:203 (+),score=44.59 TRINITY_DN8884_c0_g1_i11:439-1047(+)
MDILRSDTAPTLNPNTSSIQQILPQIIPLSQRSDTSDLQIEAEDCVTIINVGCKESAHFVAFTDGDLLESLEYEGYGYYQSSGWFLLDTVENDYTRWCSPSGSVGMHIQKDLSDGSTVVNSGVSGSGREVERCLNPSVKFDFLEYNKMSSQISDEFVDKFFTLKNVEDAKLTCEEVGGDLENFLIFKSSTVLYVDQNCEISK